jgi:hypothetical protein
VAFVFALVVVALVLRPIVAARKAASARALQAAVAARQTLLALQQAAQLQADCLAHTDRSDMIVLSTDRSDIDGAFIGAFNDGYWFFDNAHPAGDPGRGATAWYQASVLWSNAFHLTQPYNGQPKATVFLHGRHAQGRPDRLVAVEAVCDDTARFSYSVLVPGSPPLATWVHLQTPALEKFFDNRRPLFRLYAGQPSNDDPAAFTIRCVSQDGWPTPDDSIDGRLNADDTVTLTPRRGYMPASDWQLLAPDGQPSTSWSSPLRDRFGGGPEVPATRP